MKGINGADVLGTSEALETVPDGVSRVGMTLGVTEFSSGSILEASALVTAEVNGDTALGAIALVSEGTVGLVTVGGGSRLDT